MKIRHSDLSLKIKNACEKAGIEDISELPNITLIEWQGIKGIGKKSLEELSKFINKQQNDK